MRTIKTAWVWPYLANTNIYLRGYFIDTDGALFEFRDSLSESFFAEYYHRQHGNEYEQREAWAECAYPKDGANRHALIFDHPKCDVRWITPLRRCIYCGGYDPCQGFDDHALSEFNPSGWKPAEYYGYVSRHLNQLFYTAAEMSFLDSIKGGDPLKIFIHDRCNPRKVPPRYFFHDYSSRELLRVAAKCWPSYRKAQEQIENPQTASSDRIIRQWAIRNPGRVSTPEARAFFQIHFGIKNIESALTKTNRKTHEYNPRQKA